MKASMPVSAVTLEGMVTHRPGSTMATSARMFQALITFLVPASLSANTAMRVASAPVPAVVVTRMEGRPRWGTMSIPQ